MIVNQYGTYKEHGHRHTRLYNIWSGIKARCNRKNNPDYVLYGARGIRVCDEWNDFGTFYWVNWKTQANNKRNNHMITFRGKRATLQQWADVIGIKANTLLYRLRRGWSVERALTT